MTLVDSNILLDIFTRTPVWWEWSLAQIEDAALHGPLLINDVIFGETSIRFPAIEDFEAALAEAGITVTPMPRMALFLADRSSVLPDFFIGAHAMVERLPLLTRDTRRYRTYFPTVELIAPAESGR